MEDKEKLISVTENPIENILQTIRLYGKHYGFGVLTESNGIYRLGETTISFDGIEYSKYQKERFALCEIKDVNERQTKTALLELKKLGGNLGSLINILKNAN